jgi:hypothetical protein
VVYLGEKEEKEIRLNRLENLDVQHCMEMNKIN